MKKVGTAIVMLIFLSQGLFAQNEVDALRYSRLMYGGTARFMGMGGAFGAVGADFSTLSLNPAGIGLYRMSEFSITPSLFGGKTISDYLGNEETDSKHNFNIGNVGIVFVNSYGRDKGLKFLQFGIGLNRLNNFNNRILTEGFSTESSLIETYVDRANGIYFGDIEDNYNGYYTFDLNPAWYTYLIDTVPGTTDQYFGAVNTDNGGVLQRREVTSRGSMNEFVFSMGANFSERVYLGGTIGMPFIKYYEESVYSEVDTENNHQGFENFHIYDELTTKGSGINFKFGTIVRPTDWLRVSGAVHTPTFYNRLSDSWITYTENAGYDRAYSPRGNFDYELETPYRLMAGLAFVLPKIGMISADYEYVDYSQARLRSTNYSFFDENAAINNVYQSASNLRFGGEVVYRNYQFRGGYAMYGSPFSGSINDGETFTYSGGLGYREKNFFIDFAYVHSVMNEDYYLYSSQDIQPQPVENTFRTNTFLLTVGLRY